MRSGPPDGSQKGIFGSGAAKAGHRQLHLGLFGTYPAGEIEGFDELLDEAARPRPEGGFALSRLEPLALARPDALALRAHRLDPARQRIRLEPGHRGGEDRRGRADGREQDRQKMSVREFCQEIVEHWREARLEVERDHLLHHRDSYCHPADCDHRNHPPVTCRPQQ
jgi:hypothetical protein